MGTVHGIRNGDGIMVGTCLANRRQRFKVVPNPAGRVAALKFSNNTNLGKSLIGADWTRSASGISSDPFTAGFTPVGSSPGLYIAPGGNIQSGSYPLLDMRIAFWLYVSMSTAGSGNFLNIGGEITLRHRYTSTYPNGKLDLIVSGASMLTLDVGTGYHGFLQVKLTASNVSVYLGTTKLFDSSRPTPVSSGVITVQVGSIENFFIDELEVYVGDNTNIKPIPTTPIS
jgi:hypothetical protein